METIYRELPQVDIAGIAFTIDLHLHEFREVANPFNAISISDIDTYRSGIRFCFDPQTRNVFEGDEEEYESRLDLTMIELPFLKELDPVGFAEMLEEHKQDIEMGRGRKR